MEDLTPQFNEAQKKLEDTRRMIKSTTELQKVIAQSLWIAASPLLPFSG
jgi:hypothetical protein